MLALCANSAEGFTYCDENEEISFKIGHNNRVSESLTEKVRPVSHWMRDAFHASGVKRAKQNPDKKLFNSIQAHSVCLERS